MSGALANAVLRGGDCSDGGIYCLEAHDKVTDNADSIYCRRNSKKGFGCHDNVCIWEPQMKIIDIGSQKIREVDFIQYLEINNTAIHPQMQSDILCYERILEVKSRLQGHIGTELFTLTPFLYNVFF